jgi:hypothetical protein
VIASKSYYCDGAKRWRSRIYSPDSDLTLRAFRAGQGQLRIFLTVTIDILNDDLTRLLLLKDRSVADHRSGA